MDTKKEKKAWREVKRREQFLNAFRGLYVFWKTTRNIKIHLMFSLLVIIFGIYFNISGYEWMTIILVIGLVFITEALNTAIEIDIDLTSPEFHPFARDTKDVAAGAVLLATFFAIVIGLIIFVPKILYVYKG
jgi:undecaprenol kinase